MSYNKTFEEKLERRAYKRDWRKQHIVQVKYYQVTEQVWAKTDQGKVNITVEDILIPTAPRSATFSCVKRGLTGIYVPRALCKRHNAAVRKEAVHATD